MFDRSSFKAIWVEDPVLGHVGRPDYWGWYETSAIGRIDIRYNA